MKHETEEERWAYNCEDCVRTREVGEVLQSSLEKMGLTAVDEFQQKLFWPVLKAMIDGVRIDVKARSHMGMELFEEMTKREKFFQDVLGHPLNPRSPKQMMNLFYSDLQQPPILKRRAKGPSTPTLDDDALQKLAVREPLLKPLVKAISEYRSLGVFLSTFVMAPLDQDGRMRCSYNICGAETYRFSSSANAFDSGTNLQNIPKGLDAKDPHELSLPNIRKIFIPDEGFTFFDLDLDRADLQVVVWEADDEDLRAKLSAGVDLHMENAKDLFGSRAGKAERQLAKSWVHGTNYGGGPRTMAANCGITVRVAEDLQKRWFAAHPGIHSWHRRVEAQLASRRYVENKFGYRRFYFDRIEGMLPEALAWIPQSTVACTINRAWLNIYETLPEVQVLLQVHDSLCGQFPTDRASELVDKITAAARVTIPYDTPLVIPTGIKTSNISWGDCA
jgi:DNA polymerase I